MSRIVIVMVVLSVRFLVAFPAAETLRWQEIDTVEEVVAAYPGRMAQLFEDLDLERPELASVAEAHQAGDVAGACRALLGYYRNNGRWAVYRRPALEASDRTDPAGEDTLIDRIVFQQEIGIVPSGKDGRLAWFHTGPDKNKQFAKRLHRQIWAGRGLTGFENTGNPKYLAHVDLRLRDWLTDPRVFNPPHPTFHNSIDYGIRVRSWVTWFYRLQQEDGFRPATRLLMLASLPRQVVILQENVWDPQLLNHASFATIGIASFAGGWPEFKATKWAADFTIAQIRNDLSVTVYPDGVQKEMSYGYHVFEANNFDTSIAMLMGGDWEVPFDLHDGIKAMRAYQVFSQRPDGGSVANGDSARHADPQVPEALLAAESTWRHVCTHGVEGDRPPGPASRVFPWAGIVIARASWRRESDWWYFDIGPFGSGHGDPDKLHLSLHAHGRDLLTDVGKFPYGGKIAQQYRYTYGKHARGHNVVLIDGYSQAWLTPEAIASDTLGLADRPVEPTTYQVTEDLVAARGSVDSWHAEYHHGKKVRPLPGTAVHARGLVVLPGRFAVVVDHIETNRPRTVEPLWHFAPQCTVETDGQGVVSTDADVGNLRIVPLGPFDWQLELVRGQLTPVPQGWDCRRDDQVIEKATAAVYRAEIASSVTFAWIMLTAKGPVPPARGAIEGYIDGVATVRVEIADQAPVRLTVPVTAGEAGILP